MEEKKFAIKKEIINSLYKNLIKQLKYGKVAIMIYGLKPKKLKWK